MKNFIFVCCFSISLLTVSSCFNDGETEYCERDFLFEFDARLENPAEHYALGDTLWLSMSIDSLTEDRLTGENINLFENDPMQLWNLTFNNVDTFDLNAVLDFQVVNDIGEIIRFTNSVFLNIT